MSDVAHQFLDFCRSKPANEEYSPYSLSKCALGQFGISAVSYDCEAQGIPFEIYATAVCLDNEEPTFGALADRVEAVLARENADA